MEKQRKNDPKHSANNEEVLSTETEIINDQNSSVVLHNGNSADALEDRSFWFVEGWEEIREPFIILFAHAIIILFGIGFLALLGWVIDIAPISPFVKEIAHIIDDYLIIFSFVVLGISFIIKIVTVILGGGKNE